MNGRLCVVALVLVVAGANERLGAQGIAGERARFDRLRFVEVIDEILTADDARRTVLETLHDDYLDELRRTLEPLRTARENYRALLDTYESLSPEEQARLARPDGNLASLSRQWVRDRLRIERQFAADVASVLGDVTRPGWERELRAQRRREILPWLSLMHEVPDLCVAVTALNHDPAPGVVRALRVYEDELDAHLRVGIDCVIAGESGDRLHGVYSGARQVTLAAIDEIAAELDRSGRAEFRQLVSGKMYPELYRDTPVHLAARAIQECEVPTEDQKAAVESILNKFVALLDAIDHALIQTLAAKSRRSERENTKIHEEFVAWRDAPSDEPYRIWYDDANRLYERRFNLIFDTARDLRRMFSTEQVDAMPPQLQILLRWHEIKR